MSCPDVSELMLWLDGELSDPREREIRDHLDACSRCRSLVEAQRRMETLWRDDWRDPEAAAFERMRRGLVIQIPWWKKQRTWMAIAAVFSVYLGVKIFYLDNRGGSLADIAVESMEVPGREVTEEDFLRDTQEVLVTPETHIEEQIEMQQAEPDQILLAQEEEEAEEPDYLGSAAPAEELTATTTGDIRTEGWQEAPEASQETVHGGDAVSSFDEPLDFFDSGLGGMAGDEGSSEMSIADETVSASATGESSFSEDSETPAYGSSGGGGVASGLVGGSATISRMADSCEEASSTDDLELENAVSCAEAAPPAVQTEPVVSVVLENGENLILLRENWVELFQLSDSVFTGEVLHLRVDSQGRVTGVGIPAGTVLPLPDGQYGNCIVTIGSD